MSNSNDGNKSYISCSCESEVLSIWHDYETQMIDFAIFYLGSEGHRLSLMNRLRHCFRVLFKGKAFSDQMILYKNDIVMLRDDLSKFIDNIDNKKEEV